METSRQTEPVWVCGNDIPAEWPTGPISGGIDLTAATMARVRAIFAKRPEHRPSVQQWEALEDLSRALEAMARGSAEPYFLLSSLPPGVGKTTVLTAFVDALLDDPVFASAGVLICLSRRSEIERLIEEMNLPKEYVREYVAVLTRKDEINKLGCPQDQHDRAPIMFTTQQLLESRAERRPFAALSELFYRGRPRTVKVWDEAAQPGAVLAITRDDLLSVVKPLRTLHGAALADEVFHLAVNLSSAPDDSTFPVPDLATVYGIDTNAAMASVRDAPEDQQKTVAALWYLSGRTCRVRQDGAWGNTALSYRATLPPDLVPAVILDASGACRATYTEWEEKRGTLRRLRTAVELPRFGGHLPNPVTVREEVSDGTATAAVHLGVQGGGGSVDAGQRPVGRRRGPGAGDSAGSAA